MFWFETFLLGKYKKCFFPIKNWFFQMGVKKVLGKYKTFFLVENRFFRKV